MFEKVIRAHLSLSTLREPAHHRASVGVKPDSVGEKLDPVLADEY
jgi:hypothetical protein